MGENDNMGFEERRNRRGNEIVHGDVSNINDFIDSFTGGNSNLSNRVDISQTDLINTLMSALLIRGDIRCRLSKQYKCGYEIRPIVWFSRQTPQIDSTLAKIGLSWKRVFVKTEDITKLCHAFGNFFSLSPNHYELMMVHHLNGILPQPLNHEEVEEVLQQVEKCSEALRPQPASDKSLRE